MNAVISIVLYLLAMGLTMTLLQHIAKFLIGLLVLAGIAAILYFGEGGVFIIEPIILGFVIVIISLPLFPFTDMFEEVLGRTSDDDIKGLLEKLAIEKALTRKIVEKNEERITILEQKLSLGYSDLVENGNTGEEYIGFGNITAIQAPTVLREIKALEYLDQINKHILKGKGSINSDTNRIELSWSKHQLDSPFQSIIINVINEETIQINDTRYSAEESELKKGLVEIIKVMKKFNHP